MSKELEALEAEMSLLIDRINRIIDDDIYGTKRTYLNYKIEILKRDILIAKLRQMLTFEKSLEPLPPIHIKTLPTPTAEEVCLALSEYYGYKVCYNEEHQQFYSEYDDGSIITFSDGEITFELFRQTLPPHIIELIGRYYKGLEEEK